MGRPKILLADDHTIVLEGLQRLVVEEFELVGAVRDGQALLRTARETKPDVIVTDISMPVMNGIEAVRRLRDDNTEAKLIVLTMHGDVQLAVEALRAGVSGYLLKHSAGEELLRAVHEVLDGRTYLSPLIAQDVLAHLLEEPDPTHSPADRLTPRQREVLQLVAEGRSLKQIASALSISRRTAESHKYELMRSLGVGSTAELVLCAVKLGMVRDFAHAGEE